MYKKQGKHIKSSLGICSVIALMAISSGADATPEMSAYESYDFTAHNNVISDPELDKMRGGFLFSNGLKVDFGISIQTMVNGILVRELNLFSDRLDEVNPDELQTVIQVGNGNIAGGGNPSDSMPNDSGATNGQGVPQVQANTVQNQVNHVAAPDITVHNGIALGNIPGLSTIIQNNVDNALIQQFNVMDVKVSGFSGFRMQNLTPILNHQAINGVNGF